jgi:hypothetical protein
MGRTFETSPLSRQFGRSNQPDSGAAISGSRQRDPFRAAAFPGSLTFPLLPAIEGGVIHHVQPFSSGKRKIQRQKWRESGKTKEKVACVELPQLAETAPLAAPLARFGKIARTASKHGTSICSFGFSILSTTGLPDPNRRSPGKRTRADRILIYRGSADSRQSVLSHIRKILAQLMCSRERGSRSFRYGRDFGEGQPFRSCIQDSGEEV